MDDTINMVMAWAVFTAPICLSALLSLTWSGWTRRPWLHLILVNLLPLPVLYMIAGSYGFAVLIYLFWLVPLVGLVVSAISLFRNRRQSLGGSQKT